MTHSVDTSGVYNIALLQLQHTMSVLTDFHPRLPLGAEDGIAAQCTRGQEPATDGRGGQRGQRRQLEHAATGLHKPHPQHQQDDPGGPPSSHVGVCLQNTS